ncbi:MAG: peptide chain release factor-like protein [Planctomycetota bacterium]
MPLPWEESDTSVEWSHPAALPEEKLLQQCRFGQGRTSGPGGQNRNKVETAVVLIHEPTEISAKASERRHMQENKSLAVFRLRLNLATFHRAGMPAGAVGTPLWRSRLSKPKKPTQPVDPLLRAQQGAILSVNPKHKDYPALLAEALDTIEAAGYELKTPAIRLGVSPSQLIKLIRHHPPAIHELNVQREKRGLHSLK